MKVLVAGSANLDILAQPAADTKHRDRKGRNTFSIGGTACNVAFSLRRAGNDVRLLTAWNNDPLTRLIERHISAAGIEPMADVVPGMPMAAFVALLTVDGDMDAAVSDTPVETHDFSEERIEDALRGVEYAVLDANLKPSSLAAIARHAHAKGIPVFVIGVSEDKVDAILFAANYLKAAFVNHIECERLMITLGSGDHSDVAEHLGAPLFVTRGDRGAVVYLPGGEKVKIKPTVLAKITNVLGVGDAFSAGIIDAMMGYDLDYTKAAEWAHSFVNEIAQSEACNAYSMNALNNLVGDLYEHSQKDKLTGLDTRRHFEANYPRFAAGTNSLLLIDCDHFKHVNDTLGHQAGDQVLRTVAGIIQATLRSVDAACRYGGDEIAVLLPRTKMEGAMSTAERMRDATQLANVNGVTLSIGLVVTSPGEDLNDAMNRADAAMYEAKRNGRNAVSVGELLFPDIKV